MKCVFNPYFRHFSDCLLRVCVTSAFSEIGPVVNIGKDRSGCDSFTTVLHLRFRFISTPKRTIRDHVRDLPGLGPGVSVTDKLIK